jgi:hypothetical protein
MEVFGAAPGGCEFHLLPDAGHFAAYEQPEKVASLLAEWLRQPEAGLNRLCLTSLHGPGLACELDP